MNYQEIKQRARQEAERMHDEWLQEHLTGTPVDEGVETGHEVREDNLREWLITGQVLPDEIKDALADLMFYALRRRTRDEWRDPALLLQNSDTPAPQTPQPNTDKTEAEAPLISELVEEYIEDKRSSKQSIQEATLENYRIAARGFIEIVGNKPVIDVDYQDGKAYRDTCLKLPPNRSKKKAYKDKGIGELLALKLPRESCLSTKTIDDNLSYLKGYFKWLKQTKRIADNPLEGVTIEATTKSYTPYTSSDLQAIFTSPLYEHSLHPYVTRTARRSNWWLLLLATYTGARLSELCQLQVSDIKSMGGVLCFSLIDEKEAEKAKQLKTKAARRIIPIHSTLLDLGLEEYRAGLQEQGAERLLPGIRLGARKAGEQASKWYNERYKASHLPAFIEQKKVFHSFRHTFIQTALKADVDLTKLQQMVGHEPKLLGATKTYAGDGYSPAQLAKELEKVEYPELDLGRLILNGWKDIPRP